MFGIKLDFIRDFRNVLGLLSADDSIEYMEQLERDTTRQAIAKLATIKMQEKEDLNNLLPSTRFEGVSAEVLAHEPAASAANIMPVEYSLEDFCF